MLFEQKPKKPICARSAPNTIYIRKKWPTTGKNSGPKTIKPLIDHIVYDLDTIRYLRNYSRLEETLPIIHKIFESIESVREKDEKLFPIDPKIETLRAARNISADDSSQLDAFVGWVGANVALAKKSNKTARQSRFEMRVAWASWFVISVCVAILLLSTGGLRSWGLKADFYDGTNFEKPLYSTQHKTINFKHQLEMGPQLPAENFSARWSGDVIAPEEGEYVFVIIVDDGARVFVDDEKIIDEWNDHDNARFEGKITLTAGPHPIRIEYYNHLDKSALRLMWKKPFSDKTETIPAWNFRTHSN